MKKIPILLLFVTTLLIGFNSCETEPLEGDFEIADTTDDGGGMSSGDADCFDCTVTVAGNTITNTYCYVEGDDFYTIESPSGSLEAPLNGLSWDATKDLLQLLCE